MNLQLAGYVAAMSDDGVDRNAEVVGNLLVRHALHNRHHHVLLPVGECFGRGRRLTDHVRDFRRDVVLPRALLQPANGWNEDVVFHLSMLREPLLVVVDVVERCRKLVVAQPVVGKILNNDLLQFAQFLVGLSVVL